MNTVAHLRCKELPADDTVDAAMMGEVGVYVWADVVEAASAEQEDDMVEVEVEVDDEEVEDEGGIGRNAVEDEDEVGDDDVQDEDDDAEDDLPTAGGYPPWAFKGGRKGATCSGFHYYIMCVNVLNLLSTDHTS